MYEAMEISQFIISVCTKINQPVTSLKLHAILYLVFEDFLQQEGKRIFHDDFQTWRIGPVVPHVYDEYCMYAGCPINQTYQTSLKPKHQEILEKIVKKYADIPTATLLKKSQEKACKDEKIF